MKNTLVLLVVGLTPAMIGPNTPNIRRIVDAGGVRPLNTVTPAVTCTVQSTLLTGLPPSDHGAVANGWYFRDLCETWLWRQSNKLVIGEKIWEAGRKRDSAFTCANMFWWYNMYSSADWSATPRPMYPADGRKIPDHYAYPLELRDELTRNFGVFPLFRFWGPATDISASEWIAQSTIHVMQTRKPVLTLCYLPHLDYNLQRLGPDITNPRLAKDLAEIDGVCGSLIDAADRDGSNVIIVSEYGITPVDDAVHINRALRTAGFIQVKVERGRELLDAGASRAFAMCDHQIAHVYVRDSSEIAAVKSLLEQLDGVECVLDDAGKRERGLDHSRSGELIALSKSNRWFSYYYWLDEERAPDFARTVDIHRKPGYDPVELFIDPDIRWPGLVIGRHIVMQKLGMRSLLQVISPGNTPLVRGSHGIPVEDPDNGPLIVTSRADLLPDTALDATAFKAFVLDHVFS